MSCLWQLQFNVCVCVFLLTECHFLCYETIKLQSHVLLLFFPSIHPLFLMPGQVASPSQGIHTHTYTHKHTRTLTYWQFWVSSHPDVQHLGLWEETGKNPHEGVSGYRLSLNSSAKTDHFNLSLSESPGRLRLDLVLRPPPELNQVASRRFWIFHQAGTWDEPQNAGSIAI